MSEQILVPEGYYAAVAVPTTTEDGTTAVARFALSKNETRKVLVAFEVIEGEFAGRRLFWDGYFTKDTAKRTVQSLRYMGFKGDDLGAAESQPLNQRVSIKVGWNTWEGKTYARVEFVNSPGGAVIKLANPMSADDRRKFAAMMRTSVAGVPEVAGETVDRVNAPAVPDAPSNGSPGLGWDADHPQDPFAAASSATPGMDDAPF